MKVKSKIWVSVFVLGLLCALLAFSIFAETQFSYSGNIDKAKEMLQVSVNARGPRAKSLALDNLALYMEENKIDPNSEGYKELEDAILNERFNCATLFLDNIDVSQGTARNRIAINKLVHFMKKHDISTHSGYAHFTETYTEKLKMHSSAVEEMRTYLDEQNSLDDYDMKPEFSDDFEGQNTEIRVNNISGYDSKGERLDNFAGLEGSDNKYYTLRYRGALQKPNSDGIHTYLYWYLNQGDKGVVFDFDFTTFGNLPKNGLKLEAGEDASSGRIFPKFLYITGTGDLTSNNGDIFLADAIVKGEWLHITVAVNPETYISEVYVEYEFVGSFDCRGQDERTFKITSPRLGQYEREGEFSLDNFMIYPGSSVRTVDLFQKMTDDEKFVFFSNYMNNEEKSVLTRKKAHDFAEQLIDKYYNSETGTFLTEDEKIKSAVDIFLKFDYEKLIKMYSEGNLVLFGNLTDEVSKINRVPGTFEQRKQLVLKIEKFLTENENLITVNENYNTYMKTYNKVKGEILSEENIEEFNLLIVRFATATTLSSMQRYYTMASELVDSGLDVSLVGKPGFEQFTNYYRFFKRAKPVLQAKINDTNSERFINCIDLIKEYKTEEEWKANFDFVEKYILITRNIIYSGEYNSNFEGFADAFNIYQNINGFFYGELQKKHIEILNAKLEKHNASNQYVERLGICAFIDIYLNENDIDEENPEIIKILEKHSLNKKSLVSEEEEYRNALIVNTEKFVETVKKFDKSKGYLEMKSVFDEAEIYYYAMNISSEEVKTAVAVYDKYSETLKNIESSSTKFNEIVLLMNKASDKKLFALLVEGLKYKDDASCEYEGVSANIEIYKKAYDDYMQSLNTVNSELEETCNVVGSLIVSGIK